MDPRHPESGFPAPGGVPEAHTIPVEVTVVNDIRALLLDVRSEQQIQGRRLTEVERQIGSIHQSAVATREITTELLGRMDELNTAQRSIARQGSMIDDLRVDVDSIGTTSLPPVIGGGNYGR